MARTIDEIDLEIQALCKERERKRKRRAALTPAGARRLKAELVRLDTKLKEGWTRLREWCPHPDIKTVAEEIIQPDCDGMFGRTIPAHKICTVCGAKV